MSEIDLILAKMYGYKECIDNHNLYHEYTKYDEMKVLRDFCKSQEQFLEVLKVYDGGRYIYIDDDEIIDRENPPSDYESD
jgi:hypothetical protein